MTLFFFVFATKNYYVGRSRQLQLNPFALIYFHEARSDIYYVNSKFYSITNGSKLMQIRNFNSINAIIELFDRDRTGAFSETKTKNRWRREKLLIWCSVKKRNN